MRTVAKLASGAIALASAVGVAAQSAGDITKVGSTQVSAMMMYVGNDEKVYILDKAENNAAQINGHPAAAAVWDIKTNTAELVEVSANPFCAAGFFLPGGNWATFGGNAPTTRDNTSITGVNDWKGDGASPDYGVVDGRKSIRLVKPCTGSVSSWGTECFEDTSNTMTRLRWYATAEALGDGTIVIIGGMVWGGYINRSDKWFTAPAERDPVAQHKNAENTLEFYPPRPTAGAGVVPSPFLVNAGGLNTYTHAFLMKSGKLFMNANISSILLDTTTFVETKLPDDPKKVVRVYPASAGVAMLPLTPENNWTPSIIFCGGTNSLSDEEWGSYHSPMSNPWEKRASDDCQRLTPEPADGSAAAYEQDDTMPDPRTMGQFVILPDGTYLMVNGARMGTAGYTTDTPTIQNLAQMPFYMSLATDEVLTPAIYDPSKPKGQRWITEGLKSSTIPRLYHSTAILLPDGRVMVAGSNPGADVSLKADNIPYPTIYDAEYFYPPYWGKARPEPQGLPKTLTYGGQYFQVTLAAGAYKSANDAASKTKVVLIRPGFTTHAMSMGQRYLQLNSTYQVASDGKITLSVSQVPANANIFTPGPAIIFVVVDGVPSIGTHLIVGSGKQEVQKTSTATVLPANAPSSKFSAAGSGSSDDDSKGGLSMGVYIAIAAAAVAILALIGFCLWRRRRSPSSEETGAAVAAAGQAARRNNPYAVNDTPAAQPSNGGGHPYTAVSPNMAQSSSNFNLPATANYDYEKAAGAAPYSQGQYASQGGY
ncbi:DUF1929-domain-containing protein, partial [Auriculariales sp. MPI-PUGE-AT-0066]